MMSSAQGKGLGRFLYLEHSGNLSASSPPVFVGVSERSAQGENVCTELRDVRACMRVGGQSNV